MKSTEYLRNFLVVTVLILTISNLCSCKWKKETTQPVVEQTVESSEEAAEKVLTFSLSGYEQGGKKTWELNGKSADISGNQVKLKNIEGKVYGEGETVTLTSNEGSFDKLNRDVQLVDNVVATTSSGAKLTTDSLTWTADNESVNTDSYVFIEKDYLKSSGKGAFAQPNFKKVRLKENVTVEVSKSKNPSEVKDMTVITCDRNLEIDYEKNIAIFNDNVVVNDKEGRITADKMQVYFEPKSESIEKVIATGNVKIFRSKNVVYSKEAIYNAKEKKVILTGEPRLVIYPEQDTKIDIK